MPIEDVMFDVKVVPRDVAGGVLDGVELVPEDPLGAVRGWDNCHLDIIGGGTSLEEGE